jgi:hypothetical protein
LVLHSTPGDNLYMGMKPGGTFVYMARDVDAHLSSLKREHEQQLAALQADAERYRWLRAHWDEPEVQKLHPWDEFSPDPDQLDEQIDAARAGTP